MKRILVYLLLLLPAAVFAQGVALKAGDPFPAIPVSNIINAPVKSIDLNALRDKKLYILNFWGTWCSPCIPEMDNLTILQKANKDVIQVIGISDEEPARLFNYLKSKPTTVWLASDTSVLFYRLFGLNAVGQSAIVDANRKIVAVVKTDSINQEMINTLLQGGTVHSSAGIKEKPVNTADDIFGVDSTLSSNFTIRGRMTGQQSRGIGYGKKGPYADRRITFVNITATGLYKEAYQITSSKQLIFEADEKVIDNYENKDSWYCADILVKPEEKDSLYSIFQKKLNAVLPVKGRIEYRNMPVYVLTNKDFRTGPSKDSVSSYGFSGMGYEGTAVTIAAFADDYLSNELELPVVDETGLPGKYDIKTTIEMRTTENVLKSITGLGLAVEKQERKMRVLVLY